MASFAVILPAAGNSLRFNDKHYKKPFAPLAGKPVWLHSAEKFLNRDDVKQLLVVISPDDLEDFHGKFGANVAILGIEVVKGGAERYASVENALKKVRDDVDYVAVHDAARPCICDEWIGNVFSEATKTGAAILAHEVAGTLKRVNEETRIIDSTIPRDHIWEAQTPQVFRRQLLLDAYARRGDNKVTDDAQLVELFGHAVSVVRGSPMNLKITTKEDLRLAEAVLKVLPRPKLAGPAHPFAGDDMWR